MERAAAGGERNEKRSRIRENPRTIIRGTAIISEIALTNQTCWSIEMGIFSIFSSLFQSSSGEASWKKSVVVLPTLAGKGIAEPVKKMVRTALSDHITSFRHGFVKDWALTDAAFEEFCESRSALFDEKSAGLIGKKLGAKYVCMVELNKEQDYIYFEGHLVDTGTGRARTATERTIGSNNREVSQATVSVAKMLFAKKAVSNDETTIRMAINQKSLYLVTGAGDKQEKFKYWKNGQRTEPFDIEGFPWHRQFKHKSGLFEAVMDGKRAAIKKNGEVFSHLTDGSLAAEVLCVVVHDGHLFAMGWEANKQGVSVATVWKNGKVLHRLGKGGRHSSACSICFHGNDVYTVGYEQNNQENGVAMVWKNGEVFASLTNGTTYAAARSICFIGNDCYVAGYEHNTSGEDVTVIWKNGESLYKLDKERLLKNDFLILAR